MVAAPHRRAALLVHLRQPARQAASSGCARGGDRRRPRPAPCRRRSGPWRAGWRPRSPPLGEGAHGGELHGGDHAGLRDLAGRAAGSRPSRRPRWSSCAPPAGRAARSGGGGEGGAVVHVGAGGGVASPRAGARHARWWRRRETARTAASGGEAGEGGHGGSFGSAVADRRRVA